MSTLVDVQPEQYASVLEQLNRKMVEYSRCGSSLRPATTAWRLDDHSSCQSEGEVWE